MRSSPEGNALFYQTDTTHVSSTVEPLQDFVSYVSKLDVVEFELHIALGMSTEKAKLGFSTPKSRRMLRCVSVNSTKMNKLNLNTP